MTNKRDITVAANASGYRSKYRAVHRNIPNFSTPSRNTAFELNQNKILE